ncbi:uncharacterized protein LOC130164264 isoform X2 [Seriola aureovittata]|uniref:uncharacterized protein LOC130164264 isoform X2 n=1 Tax=Seriola aureovittata TaxID=2871759 RepID=UPI0024BE8FF2|nr:uncharacterized protein LOC130164264 isoform X2 [Seriola aureovittata]
MKMFVMLLYMSQHASALEIYEGDDFVLLPCEFSTNDLGDPSVVWSRSDLRPSTVHQRQLEGDELKDQNQDYRDRTSMRTDALQTGDLSLTLRRPTIRDSSTYTCIIREGGREVSRREVPLEVKERPDWCWILLAVLVLLVLLVVAVFGVRLFKEMKNTVDRPPLWPWVLSAVLLLTAAGLVFGVSVFKGVKNTQDRPPLWPWVLSAVLLLTAAVLVPGVTVYKRMKYTEHRNQWWRLFTEDEWLKIKEPFLLRVKVLSAVLVLLLVVVLSVVTSHQVKNNEVSQHGDTVEVYGGGSVLLPCEDSPLPRFPTVTWSRSDFSPSTVHQRDEQGDDLRNQNQRYSSRTSMKTDALTTGDLSLTLTRLRPSDSGNYTCIITVFGNDQRLRDIQLQVKEPFSSLVEFWVLLVLLVVSLGGIVGLGQYMKRFIFRDKDVEVEEGEESVQLPFKTTPHLSADVRVEWTDRDSRKVHVYQNGSDRPEEQDQVYRDRTEMKKDPLRTGDLSLTLKHLTERDRYRYNYTCRVYKDGHFLRGTRVFLKVRGQRVEVEEGEESVQLPFKTTAHLSGDIRVEWTDRDSRKVHVYQNGSDGPEEQDQVYRDRTEMKKDPLRTGDLSLNLKHPTVRDTGDYTCRVYKDGDLLRGTAVNLWVKGQEVEVKEGEESVQLPFKTTAHLSGDVRVEWIDDYYRKVHVYQNGSDRPEEQNQVYRDRTEMKEDPLRTGDLSLTLKHLTERDRGRYTCTVYKDGHLLRGTTVTFKVKERTQVKDETVDIKNRSSSTDSTPLMADLSV